MGIVQSIFLFLGAFILGRASAAVENLALRQQVAVFKQSVKRPKLRPRDRVFWVVLSRLWPNWRSALAIVQPETVIKWHRKGFKLYWRWKSRPGKPGRPPIKRKIRNLIRRMSRENPTWGAPRIVSAPGTIRSCTARRGFSVPGMGALSAARTATGGSSITRSGRPDAIGIVSSASIACTSMNRGVSMVRPRATALKGPLIAKRNHRSP